MTLTLFGIPNCDTVRKARRWLDSHGVEYRFHDLRADGLDSDVVGGWIDAMGWEQVINRRSTSWKDLGAQRRAAMGPEEARQAALEAPTLIRRPVLVGGDLLEFGFSERRYAELLS